jgi:uncharacterized membrane protein YfcA
VKGWVQRRLASRVEPETLRWAVVCIGTVVGIVYLVG